MCVCACQRVSVCDSRQSHSRGVLLRRSVAAVCASRMSDVTVNTLINEETGEDVEEGDVDASRGVLPTPRSAVVLAVTDFGDRDQRHELATTTDLLPPQVCAYV